MISILVHIELSINIQTFTGIGIPQHLLPSKEWHQMCCTEKASHVMFGLHFTSQIHWTASFPFLSFLTPKPMYDTIWQFSLVQYDLAIFLSMIQASGSSLYDINLRATHTTILSTRGVEIPICLVSSATDSVR